MAEHGDAGKAAGAKLRRISLGDRNGEFSLGGKRSLGGKQRPARDLASWPARDRPAAEFTFGEQRLGVVNQRGRRRLRGRRAGGRQIAPHVMRTADPDARVVTGPLREERAQPACAATDHELDLERKVPPNVIPGAGGVQERVERDTPTRTGQRPQDIGGPRQAPAFARERHLIVDHQNSWPLAIMVGVARARHRGPRRQMVALKVDPVASDEYCLVRPLQRDRPVRGAGASEFDMIDRDPRVVNGAVPRCRQAYAEIRFLVVRRGVCRIEAAQRLEQRAPDQQERAGAVIDVVAKIELSRIGIVVAAVAKTGAVVPDDAAGFLQDAAGPDQLGRHGTDVIVTGQGFAREVETAGSRKGIVVEKQQRRAGRRRGALVRRAQEMDVFRIGDDMGAPHPRKQRRRFVG